MNDSVFSDLNDTKGFIFSSANKGTTGKRARIFQAYTHVEPRGHTLLQQRLHAERLTYGIDTISLWSLERTLLSE